MPKDSSTIALQNRILLGFFRQGFSFFLIYFGLCFIISGPIIFDIWNILFSNPVPTGGDPADHALFVLKILGTGNPLLEYTQFPTLSNESAVGAYYPSFLHILISIPTYLMIAAGSAPFTSVIIGMNSFMFLSYLLGIIGYGLLIYHSFTNIILTYRKEQQQQQQKYIQSLIVATLAILAFSIFMYSTSPIIKTFRDGGYGEMLAMWTLVPFYIYGLMRGRWIVAGILFAVIASTHNISLVLTLIITLSYFISLLVGRSFRILKDSWKLVVVASVCCIPAFIYFYYPVIIMAGNQETGMSGTSAQWTRTAIAEQIGYFLYYFGIVAALGLLFISYRKSTWIVSWVVLYLVPFSFNIFFLERLAREFAIPFGLSSALFTASILFIFLTKFYPRFITRFAKRYHNRIPVHQVVICLIVTLVIVPFYYELSSARFESFGQPQLLNYYSEAMSSSNAYLLNADQAQNGSVVLFGVNPWLKPYGFGQLTVLEVETVDMENSLSKRDREINKELRSVLEDPDSDQIDDILRRYNIKYIFLSDVLNGRWYTESQHMLNDIFAHFEERYDRNKIHLEQQWRGDEGELLQVYSVKL